MKIFPGLSFLPYVFLQFPKQITQNLFIVHNRKNPLNLGALQLVWARLWTKPHVSDMVACFKVLELVEAGK